MPDIYSPPSSHIMTGTGVSTHSPQSTAPILKPVLQLSREAPQRAAAVDQSKGQSYGAFGCYVPTDHLRTEVRTGQDGPQEVQKAVGKTADWSREQERRLVSRQKADDTRFRPTAGNRMFYLVNAEGQQEKEKED